MHGTKKLLSMIGVLVMLGAMLVPAAGFAATEDTASGTFSNNNSPSIDYVKLYTVVSPAETTTMQPLTEYDARVKVTDADGKTDLTTIVVKIYYDSDTEGTTEIEYDGKTADTQNCVIITWTQSSGVFSIDPSASTTWVIGTGVEPGDLSVEFQFKFTVGKVATEAAGGDADDWQIAAKVTDDSSETAWAADSDGATMAWYGEIDVPTATVDWGTVNPGMDFGEGDPSEEALSVTVNYIANSPYDEKVKTGTTWSGAPSGTATLDDTGNCATEQYFALKADDSGTLSTAVLVDTTGVAIDESGLQTGEDGDDAGNNTLWLKLASTFTKATYSGTITYIIANGS